MRIRAHKNSEYSKNQDIQIDFEVKAFLPKTHGSLDFEEFIQALSISSRGDIKEKLTLAFSIYDLNNDQAVTKDEMLKIDRALYALDGNLVDSQETEDLSKQRVDAIFNQMDTDHDDTLSREEFINGYEKDPSVIRVFSLYENLV